LAEGGVQALSGFIEQEHAGGAQEGAGNGAALLLAAGEFAGPPGGDVGELELFEGVFDLAGAFAGREGVSGEGEVVGQGHVREKGVVLKNVAAAAGLGGEVNAGFAVIEDGVIEQDPSGGGGGEAGDGIEGEGFAGAGGPEQDGDTGAGFEGEIEGEAAGAGAGGERVFETDL
jgi:hypothetical protein